MKMKKVIAFILAATTLMAVSGCGQKKDGGKVTISVGNWPDETQQESLERANKIKDDFMLKNPDIKVNTDTYKYDVKTFSMKASAKQLPTVYQTWFTEISQIINQGYAADLTEYMKKYGFDTALNPDLLKLTTGSDGKIYGIPYEGYEQALYINKNIFKEAGLVNEDGSIKAPDTWEELAEDAKIIKEKTGKAGFVLPTTNNSGGWQFLNIAWAFGVEFEKQREDGSWEATFNTQEAKDALQFIKDLKWKYNALVDDSVVNQEDMNKYFGTEQAAMMICDIPYNGYTYGLDNSNLYATKMPSGKAGRYSQMGGNVYMMASNATSEQIDAAFKWLEFGGFTPNITDEELANYETNFQTQLAQHAVIVPKEAMPIWTNSETSTKLNQLRQKYANADYNDYKGYYEATDVTIKPEPSACAQQLYSVLDGCIQEVITNKDADVNSIISNANNDFQVNHLDKMN